MFKFATRRVSFQQLRFSKQWLCSVISAGEDRYKSKIVCYLFSDISISHSWCCTMSSRILTLIYLISNYSYIHFQTPFTSSVTIHLFIYSNTALMTIHTFTFKHFITSSVTIHTFTFKQLINSTVTIHNFIFKHPITSSVTLQNSQNTELRHSGYPHSHIWGLYPIHICIYSNTSSPHQWPFIYAYIQTPHCPISDYSYMHIFKHLITPSVTIHIFIFITSAVTLDIFIFKHLITSSVTLDIFTFNHFITSSVTIHTFTFKHFITSSMTIHTFTFKHFITSAVMLLIHSHSNTSSPH